MTNPIPGRVESFNIEGAAGTLLPAPRAPRVPVGLSTVLGILGAIGAVVAAVHGNDFATAAGTAAALVTMLGRYGQAIVSLAPGIARRALPWVRAVADLPDEATGVK